MSKIEIKSIFEQIAEKVFKMNDLESAKSFIIEFVESKNINISDKGKIIAEVNKVKTIQKLWFYISNSLLKYEGLGKNQIDKTARKAASETEFEEC